MVKNSQEEQINQLLGKIKVNNFNKELRENIRHDLETKNMIGALELLKKLQEQGVEYEDEEQEEELIKEEKEELEIGYPKNLASDELERKFIGMLLNEIKAIAIYYFPFKECYFINDDLLNIYKMVLFTDAEKFAPGAAKEGFNFAKKDEKVDRLKYELKNEFKDVNDKIDRVYTELRKLFILRKNYLGIPVRSIQKQIADITNYELYGQMSVEEVESAIEQVTVTEKFKRAVLNENITDFLVKGNNTLTNGLALPFPVLTNVFKGVRQGETMAFAMPSNAGKSRFTINIATYIALMHKKKVLIISNEMSEEKMKLCVITTILNNPEIQKLHGQKLHISEGELLEFKFRPDEGTNVKTDKDGYVLKEEGESQEEFATKLKDVSKEFNMVIAVTDWFNEQIGNFMYFINITDHTNDELKKVIMNYYYKEKVEYVFYDTLKTDIENIGNGEEIKKTATILANLAQNFNMYIASTLQLAETNTDPINLNINDLAVSRTVKEVLDTLCLFKQIHNEDLEKYEYSLNEVDTKFFDLEKFEDPDVRYYSCIVDKNRAGSKPKLLFRLNLAYNDWKELGYLRLKS